MARVSLLLILFSLLINIHSIGQTYYSGWKFQIELMQVADGQLEIVYSKRMVSPLSSEAVPGGPDFLITQNNGMSHGQLMMPANNTNTGDYTVNRDYFKYINKNIPPVITLPETTNKKGFPDPTKNQYYPKPDGN
ncbi:hypothetical protein [Fulvivirga sedimenti]|uniref:Uncharacterized protein n=1 Tax=Fulvivirga sedimenti TaxID=2879465 RepID=A0A9X1HVI0_9BACT|nr:hypothetical protein [Fulvivirga sedimenti]MCA6079033.1 hypothetical protein [Fulvivirga sedimenti]